MSDDEPPPLEDMTEYLVSKGIEIPMKSKPLPPTPQPNPPPPSALAKPDPPFVSGMKKGFFNSAPSKPKAAQKKQPEIIEVRAKPLPENPLKLKEVQDAMQYTNENSSEWLTPQLLQRLAEHPFLAKGMTDPRLMEAVNELQKNPSLATTKYKYDQEVQVFFTEFSKIMADHFGRMAESKQKGFEDPEVKRLLEDPDVARVIKAMQKGKRIDFHQYFLFRMAARDEVLTRKLKILIDKGVIKIN